MDSLQHSWYAGIDILQSQPSCIYARGFTDCCRCATQQTAHDKSFLVKQLLTGLPPVTRRVAEMRAGKAPGPGSSQVGDLPSCN